MDEAPGPDPGQDGLSWEEYVDWLVESHGTLTAVAEKLASTRAFADDVGSIERALRRLRKRKNLAGGVWGTRALAAFGVPGAADARARFLGTYHSRFTDLPLPICLDFLRLWDRPPLNEAPAARAWIALGHATCALRQADFTGAKAHLKRARASFSIAPLAARIEMLLVEAFVASREEKEKVPALLSEVEPLLLQGGDLDSADVACLRARWIDQRAYELNHREPPALEEAEALYRSLPDHESTPPFARCRRENGLAYARWKLGDRDAAADLARSSARHAGDGGHLRLRAMALSMLSRILRTDTPEGKDAAARASAIVTAIEDEALRLRFRLRSSSSSSTPGGTR
jgi:hypothetical protein